MPFPVDPDVLSLPTQPGLITAQDVVLAVRATLANWLPATLFAVANGDKVLPMPKAHEAPTAEALKRDAAQLPVQVVSTPGMAGPLVRDENGIYTARWPVAVQFLIRSEEGTYGATQRDLHLYAAAIRTVLIERPTLDGFAKSVDDVTEEAYDDADPSAARTLAEGAVSCVVEVFDAARTGTGFTEPVTPVTATTTEVTVQPV